MKYCEHIAHTMAFDLNYIAPCCTCFNGDSLKYYDIEKELADYDGDFEKDLYFNEKLEPKLHLSASSRALVPVV